MPDDFEAERPDEEQEGGPVKSFLEHLEDLRWVLIKSAVALAVCMLFCLIAGNHVVRILKWPLTQARIHYPGTNQVVSLRYFGTNQVAVYQLTPEQQQSLPFGTNRFAPVQIEFSVIDNHQLLTWRVDPDPAAVADMKRLHVDLINLSPAGGFVVAFQVALYGGLVLAGLPISCFVALFVFPALKLRERKYVYRALFYGGGLFILGVSFCYFILMPVALSASQLYSQWLGFGAYQWKAEDYISFVCKFMLGMGLGFQLPVVLLTLVKIGVLSYPLLRKMWRYMIVITLVLGAVLTTPEVITQVLMAGPLYLLYEISVWMAWYWEQPDRAKARRRLALALGIALLLGALVWLGIKYGWPWLQQIRH
jgi:sec-independent protein translocase protein TatC